MGCQLQCPELGGQLLCYGGHIQTEAVPAHFLAYASVCIEVAGGVFRLGDDFLAYLFQALVQKLCIEIRVHCYFCAEEGAAHLGDEIGEAAGIFVTAYGIGCLGGFIHLALQPDFLRRDGPGLLLILQHGGIFVQLLLGQLAKILARFLIGQAGNGLAPCLHPQHHMALVGSGDREASDGGHGQGSASHTGHSPEQGFGRCQVLEHGIRFLSIEKSFALHSIIFMPVCVILKGNDCKEIPGGLNTV